ncbi:hypothetical protein EDC04DRAFT_1299715 [Pisolithus marmoratus]|nr:hypothetical protein EDC04DRAFT_1299715 [Pisolithus marmoratus]
MAAEGHPNMHNDPPPSLPTLQDILASLGQPRPPSPTNDKPYVARSTSTAPPYMSIDVLRGKPHTYFDDIESFLYVLVLFFFSYKGPLEEEALKRARVQGFVQSIGGGRLPHVTSWPDIFESWASGSFTGMSNRKFSDLSPRFAHLFLEECYLPLRTRWAHGSDDLTILRAILKLIVFAWMLFPENDRKVNHRQFGDVLRKWLKECADEESRYVYPFDD